MAKLRAYVSYDRRLGRACLLAWAQALDPAHPALAVMQARFA
jgi:hypothetical protein